MSKIDDCIIIEIPKIKDRRGNLAVVEKDTIPFAMQRIYYLFDVPAGAYRGGHAHRNQQAFLIAMSGSFEVILDDGSQRKSILLNRPDQGLLIRNGIWREIQNFSQGGVALVVSSDPYDEADYIRDYDAFVEYKNR